MLAQFASHPTPISCQPFDDRIDTARTVFGESKAQWEEMVKSAQEEEKNRLAISIPSSTARANFPRTALASFTGFALLATTVRPTDLSSITQRKTLNCNHLARDAIKPDTSGWLHKELRSDNIIFIRKADSFGDDDPDLSTYSMYVAGYVYARTDDPQEMTEYPKLEAIENLYRHPLSLGKSRLSYRKSFDIFSVGCTLLEIGLWSSLRQILERHSAWLSPMRRQMQRRHQSHQGPSPVSSTSTCATLVDHPEDDEKDGGDENENGGITHSPDLMMLRHELFLSQLPDQKVSGTKTGLQEAAPSRHHRCRILRSLTAATGNLYTSIVEELLSTNVGNDSGQDVDTNEHEYALDLEIKARDTIQAIANAI